MRHIVKRAGHNEPYDNRKLYASIYSAGLALRTPPAAAELAAENVCKSVDKWIENKHEVTSADITREAYKHFHVLHPDAAWIYKHHRNVS